jgi:putative oxidoreductase
LAVFTVAVTQVVVRGINVECGCFGGAAGPVTALTIARDVGLFAAALFYYFVADPAARAQPVSAP